MSANARSPCLHCVTVVVGTCMWVGAVLAQETRDPTVPPIAASAEVSPNTPARSPLGSEGISVIVREGQPGLVVGTRVVLPGQRVGAWTLERITETEVWLRDGKNLRKLPRFSGIERRDPAAHAAACEARNAASAPTANGKRKVTKKITLTSTPADTQCDAPPTRSSNP